jgi:hypothetical protein
LKRREGRTVRHREELSQFWESKSYLGNCRHRGWDNLEMECRDMR